MKNSSNHNVSIKIPSKDPRVEEIARKLGFEYLIATTDKVHYFHYINPKADYEYWSFWLPEEYRESQGIKIDFLSQSIIFQENPNNEKFEIVLVSNLSVNAAQKTAFEKAFLKNITPIKHDHCDLEVPPILRWHDSNKQYNNYWDTYIDILPMKLKYIKNSKQSILYGEAPHPHQSESILIDWLKENLPLYFENLERIIVYPRPKDWYTIDSYNVPKPYYKNRQKVLLNSEKKSFLCTVEYSYIDFANRDVFYNLKNLSDNSLATKIKESMISPISEDININPANTAKANMHIIRSKSKRRYSSDK